MSRPTTRNKNKRQRPEDSDESSSKILRKIHSTGEITQDDIHHLYLIWKPVCQGCRVNSKDSPNCFCGLIPPPNGARKSGLWQKMSDIVVALGPDPCKDLRSCPNSPAGLTNLGATCYANSIVQCLYMNTSFRSGVFSLEPDLLKQHPVLDQLAQLFAQLHASEMAFIDSAPFIKTLELDNGVQQDSHEFLTLFLSLLERSLSHSKVCKARTIVQDLFRGRVSHVTRCSMCGKDSEASSTMEDFYELELNIKGFNNLDESLEDYLSVEELHGENQYFCESCGKRVDATRCIKLRSLPTVLNFQLKRCVFLPKTTTKKKITSAFSFRRQLNMTRRLSDHSQSELIYDLSAILIHKGTAVDSGHYVAHIKDEFDGHWWEFDDEHVSKLGIHPFGEGPSTVKSEPIVQPACSEQLGSVVNGNPINIAPPSSPDISIGSCQEIFSSTDAYMLMYTHRHDKENSGKLGPRNFKDALPSHLSKEIEELNVSYVSACQEYKLKKDRLVQNIKEHREEVRLLLSEAPVNSLEERCFWISTDWLRQWADVVTPPTIDNTPIQCLHGRVPISKVGTMKRVSNKAWHQLLSKYGGGPELSSDDYCIDCLKDGAKTMVCIDNYRDRRASMKELAEAALAGTCLEGNLYYISKAWLLQWIRRKNIDTPCDADSGPTASLRCPHGELLPEQAVGAKRLLVPENLWLFLCESATAVKADDPLGCSPFPLDSETCTLCNKELTQVASLEDSLRAAKIKQRQNHEKLFQGKSIPLSPGSRYHLLPSSWLSKWRTYITSSGKNVSSSVEPDSLDDILDSLKCDKHSRLLERPLDLTCKRGVIVQRISATDGLTIITESDWKCFCEEWKVPEGKGIYAEIYYSCTANKLAGSCEEMPLLESQLDPSVDEVNGELESKEPIIKTNPEVVKENQTLHKGSREIEGESATLADMNIFPGDVLWVTDSEIHENRDIADELSKQKMDLQQAEEGFRGTLLTSNLLFQG
ncbi:ubiquitin carboxyl-terminal hydrolase 26-like isoform X2 [Tasmannia lanceolata]|uniref:ubiquitin carboxyl-terminal hydrolase 26-like isoform X2 n=1 Tax=Tasmannia lanceolata TaxID=3420 RepID=UPI0040631344